MLSAVQSSDPPLKLDRAQQNIMLVDRGPTNSYTPACKFTEKVWHAQNAGAVAVLVVNYDDTQTTMVCHLFVASLNSNESYFDSPALQCLVCFIICLTQSQECVNWPCKVCWE